MKKRIFTSTAWILGLMLVGCNTTPTPSVEIQTESNQANTEITSPNKQDDTTTDTTTDSVEETETTEGTTTSTTENPQLSNNQSVEIVTDPQPQSDSGSTTTSSDSHQTISVEQARSIALAHAGLKEENVTFLMAELELDDGIWEYEIEFYAGNKEYDYEINAVTGAILSYDYEVESRMPTNDTPVSGDNTELADTTELADNTESGSEVILSETQIKTIALNHVGVTTGDVTYYRAELDFDDGKWEYEVEFNVGRTEYEFEIHAITGEILKFEKEND